MPRRKIIHKPDTFDDYQMNNKYDYDVNILKNNIIQPLEYFRQQSLKERKDYQVVEATIVIELPDYYGDMDDVFFEPAVFDVSHINEVLSRDHYWWSWTFEYSEKRGYHYHLMIVYCDGDEIKHCKEIQSVLSKMRGVKSVYCSPRFNQSNKWCHHLNQVGINGIDDAVTRHCYRAKLNQKEYLEGRTFNRCFKLNSLAPRKGFNKISERNIVRKTSSVKPNQDVALPF